MASHSADTQQKNRLWRQFGFAQHPLSTGLRRGGSAGNFHPQLSQVPCQLLSSLILNPGNAQTPGCLDVGLDVVYINRLAGLRLAGLQGLQVKERTGLAGAKGAGVDTRSLWEVTKERVVRFQEGDVDGVGIGKQSQAVALLQGLEEHVGLQRLGIERLVPGIGELLEGKVGAQPPREMQVPV